MVNEHSLSFCTLLSSTTNPNGISKCKSSYRQKMIYYSFKTEMSLKICNFDFL